MDGSAIDWVSERVLRALAHDEPIEPAALQLLLTRYVATGRDDLRDAIGPALSHAIDTCVAGGSVPDAGPTFRAGDATPGRNGAFDRRAGWLMVFVEAAAISDDERLDEAIETLVESLRRKWPSSGEVWHAMQSIEACLSASQRLAEAQALVQAAVDELERVVGVTYEPGEGLLSSLQPGSNEPGRLRDHVAAASALLNAYAIVGRLPYSMLAEELIQHARRSWWDAARGGFWGETSPDPFFWNCQAARVLCRLAALHEDPEYRAVAVIAHQSDYAADATRTLESLDSLYRERGHQAAIYGVALGEWLAMR